MAGLDGDVRNQTSANFACYPFPLCPPIQGQVSLELSSSLSAYSRASLIRTLILSVRLFKGESH